MTISEVSFVPFKDGKLFRKYSIVTRKAINAILQDVTTYYFDTKEEASHYLDYLNDKEFLDDVIRSVTHKDSSMTAKKEFTEFMERPDMIAKSNLMKEYSLIKCTCVKSIERLSYGKRNEH